MEKFSSIRINGTLILETYDPVTCRKYAKELLDVFYRMLNGGFRVKIHNNHYKFHILYGENSGNNINNFWMEYLDPRDAIKKMDGE